MIPNEIEKAGGVSSDLLAAMADGIGDLVFATPEWVSAAGEALSAAVAWWADDLKDLGKFSFCEVAHNAPAYLHQGSSLSWHAKFDGASVQVAVGELDESECDLKIESDHSIMSNMGRIRFHGNDPRLVASAQARLGKLARWEIHGTLPENQALGSVLRSLHDVMAERTMPRFVFMTPEWVSTARHIVSTRAEKYAEELKNISYTFSEEFTDTPKYAFPDGSHGGFWVHCNHGQVTVGAGPLPEELEPADALTKGCYTPVVPVGRDVTTALTDEDQTKKAEYSKAAFRFDKVAGKRPVDQSSPSGKGPMGPELGKVMMVLHDELSKRTTGCLPCDYDTDLKPEWSAPPSFDRDPGYDKSWLKYDEVDIYGNPR
jgi:hypothetical protein